MSTNHMLNDLVQRRPPEPDMTECNDRLRRIENLLDNILGGNGRRALGSRVRYSSVLRRLISSFRDPSRYQPPGLHAPTSVRAPPTSYDPERMEFLNAPPPCIRPVCSRSPHRFRPIRVPRSSGTASPSPISPPPRTHSAPLDDGVRFDGMREERKVAAVGATITLLSFEQELAILVRVLVHQRGQGGLPSYSSPTILP